MEFPLHSPCHCVIISPNNKESTAHAQSLRYRRIRKHQYLFGARSGCLLDGKPDRLPSLGTHRPGGDSASIPGWSGGRTPDQSAAPPGEKRHLDRPADGQPQGSVLHLPGECGRPSQRGLRSLRQGCRSQRPAGYGHRLAGNQSGGLGRRPLPFPGQRHHGRGTL